MWRYILLFVVLISLVLLICSCERNENILKMNITPGLPDRQIRIYDLVKDDVMQSTTLESIQVETTILPDVTVTTEPLVNNKVFPEDASFWLNIPNTNIDYPVMWSENKDSDYWLFHTPEGEKSDDGSLFLDTATGGIATGITVINGHNNKNKKMFSELTQYKTQSFADEHTLVKITDRNNIVREYRVFSVLLMDVNREAIQLLFRNEKSMRDYIDGLVVRSLVTLDVEIDYNNILALSTCSYEGTNYRCIVLCTLIS